MIYFLIVNWHLNRAYSKKNLHSGPTVKCYLDAKVQLIANLCGSSNKILVARVILSTNTLTLLQLLITSYCGMQGMKMLSFCTSSCQVFITAPQNSHCLRSLRGYVRDVASFVADRYLFEQLS